MYYFKLAAILLLGVNYGFSQSYEKPEELSLVFVGDFMGI